MSDGRARSGNGERAASEKQALYHDPNLRKRKRAEARALAARYDALCGPVTVHIAGPQPDPDCGGCNSQGAHRRWCRVSVGLLASARGKQAEAAENLADSVGSNNPGAANHLYAASALLRAQAMAHRADFQAGTGR